MGLIDKDIERYISQEGKVKLFGFKYLLLFSNKALIPIFYFRLGKKIYAKEFTRIPLVIRVFLKSFYLLFKPLVMYGCKINIHEDSRIFIDEGLYLSNKGGILIGAKSLGKNCTIHENVTIGMDRNGKLPTLGDNVTIHRNSLIYGNIKIGDNAVIMEDTVLNRSIPPNIRVSGNPAKLVK